MLREYAADLIVEDQVIVEQGARRAERRACPALPKLPASDRQAALPADQLRPVQSRNAPHHRPGLITRTIPFIPLISR